METSELKAVAEPSQRKLGSVLRDRRLLLGAAGAVAAGAAAMNWSWLVAVGVAPLIVSAAPCIAMCALGLCMKGMGGKCDRNPVCLPEREIVAPVPEATSRQP